MVILASTFFLPDVRSVRRFRFQILITISLLVRWRGVVANTERGCGRLWRTKVGAFLFILVCLCCRPSKAVRCGCSSRVIFVASLSLGKPCINSSSIIPTILCIHLKGKSSSKLRFSSSRYPRENRTNRWEGGLFLERLGFHAFYVCLSLVCRWCAVMK